MDHAEIGIANLKKVVDTLVVIPNEKLMQFASRLPILESFKHADDVLRQGIQGISDLIVTPALINLDFADVCTVMRNSGIAHMGIGHGKGEKRTVDAVKQAVFSPLLETSIEGASKVILNIMGSPDVTLDEIQEATQLVREVVLPGANIIFGADIRESMNEEIMVTIIATGFMDEKAQRAAFQQAQQQAAQPERHAAPAQREQVQSQSSSPFNPMGQEPPFARSQAQPVHNQQPQQTAQTVNSSRISVEDDFPEFLRRLNNKNKK